MGAYLVKFLDTPNFASLVKARKVQFKKSVTIDCADVMTYIIKFNPRYYGNILCHIP